MPSFWLSLFFLWPFWLILHSASTPPSLALPKARYFLLYSTQFSLFACADSCTTLCQWFTSIHLYFSAFCFSPVPHFTLCFRHIELNSLTAPNFKILFWGQIKAVQLHYVPCSFGTSRFSPPVLCEEAELPAEADAGVSTSLGWAGISQLSSFCWQAAGEFWHKELHRNVLGSRLQVVLLSETH